MAVEEFGSSIRCYGMPKCTRWSNVVDMTTVLRKLQQEGLCVTPEIVQRLSPYPTEHIKRFGLYVLDMATQPGPLQPQPLFGAAA